ncbi:unnamed protein product [Cuscuta europaea]|uniref:BI1-like protein n=1 Tax=Cuscuta europaea TaxID=41803 RepID=A0A9P0ZJV1_CUSEU|nr:unnamed protein product [Cuscuta europaea]
MPSIFDIEAGKTAVKDEDAEMRWAFIRKVYALVSLQLFLCTAVGVAMYLIPAVKTFLNTTGGLIAFIAVIVLVFVFLIAMICYSKIHPWNYVLLLLFTFAVALMIGASCTYKKGIYVLMAAGATVLVFVVLTLFTFWAAKKGWDFNFLGPFLMCCLMVLIAFGFVKDFLNYLPRRN